MEELIKLIQEAQDKWGRETVQAIIDKIDEYPIEYKGLLRRSIFYEQNNDEIDFRMADYGEFVDEGVDGTENSVGSRFKFRGKVLGTEYYIREWANSKNLNSYAVAWTIQRKGITPRPFFKSVIESRIENLGEAILKAEEQYLTKQLEAFSQ